MWLFGTQTTEQSMRRRLAWTGALSAMVIAILAGCLGLVLASKSIERKILSENTQSYAKIIHELHLPHSKKLVEQLKEISGCQILITEGDLVVAGTLESLPSGKTHWLDSAELAGVPVRRLWLCRPKGRLQDTLHGSFYPILLLMCAAGALALLISLWLASDYQHLIRKMAEAERRLAKAEQLAMAGRLSASVVHELRNPLSGIKMNAQVLAEERRADGEDEECLQMIVREIDRIDLYLRGLTDLAGANPQNQDSCTANVNEVVSSLKTLVQGRCQHLGVKLDTRLPEKPIVISCNQGELIQVLLNLVTNALDVSTNSQTVKIVAEADGKVARIQVVDAGPGVLIEDNQDIFAPFVSDKQRGCGLGLHISRQIVERYNGTIEWQNPPEGGAIFTVQFPLA